MTIHPPLPTIRPLLDPAPEYAKWQSEEPIRRVTIRGDNSPWLITRYEDARAVLADERFSADANHPDFPTPARAPRRRPPASSTRWTRRTTPGCAAC
ncbi:hypothetical protein WKI71_35680 [Streptomyces sp. MS1.AVA.1]|uniref:Cytochrome P450 n=1 Tax=Streptomyces machairae TaxID=3134109 RepID=A0ABU8US67_9ACTN